MSRYRFRASLCSNEVLRRGDSLVFHQILWYDATLMRINNVVKKVIQHTLKKGKMSPWKLSMGPEAVKNENTSFAPFVPLYNIQSWPAMVMVEIIGTALPS